MKTFCVHNFLPIIGLFCQIMSALKEDPLLSVPKTDVSDMLTALRAKKKNQNQKRKLNRESKTQEEVDKSRLKANLYLKNWQGSKTQEEVDKSRLKDNLYHKNLRGSKTHEEVDESRLKDNLYHKNL